MAELENAPAMPLDEYFDGQISSLPVSRNTPIKRERILGLPLNFTSSADPNMRVFSKTLIRDIPVVSIIPGRPQFLGKASASESGITANDIIGMLMDSDLDGDESAIYNFLQNNTRAFRDFRYYGFAPDYAEYFKYVQTMLSTLHVKMGLGTIYNFGDDFSAKFSDGGALAFYADKATSVSESADTEFGSSKIDGLAKTVSGLKRELDFILGADISHNDIERMKTQREIQKSGKTGTDLDYVANLEKGGGFLSRLMSRITSVGKAATTLWNGAQLLFPEIWQDSTFSKSYNLSFKFHSPYGNAHSIFHHVYVPFIALLALALPRQHGLMGYFSPFLIKVDRPGWFTCNMGVVTSLTFKKAGSDDLWSEDGLPLEIEVSLNVKDLYPVLMMSKTYTVLASNNGMADFLENMAGVSFTDVKIGSEIHAVIAQKINAVAGAFTHGQNVLKNEWARWLDNGGIPDRLRSFIL